MRTKIAAGVVFVIIVCAVPWTVLGIDWRLGENFNVNIKGDLTYALKVRTQNPEPAFVTLGKTTYCSGDANFAKGDLANNGVISRIEVTADLKPHFTVFGRIEPFYDFVYNDDKYDWETRKHAEYNFTDGLEYYLEGRFGRFTSRLGRQIVQWGESVAPVYAPGVNVVSPFFVQKVVSAGWTSRDYQVPTYMLWASYKPSKTLAFEGVYAPDFDPRYLMPVVGTIASPADILGFGVDSTMVDDQRPEGFENQQQAGGAVRMVFPSLNNFELGVYYYHYLVRFPKMTTLSEFPPRILVEYPKIDMVGMSFSQAIQAYDLDLQIGGELAYRWNDAIQKDLVNSPFMAEIMGMDITPSAGGWERGHTLNWDLNGMRMFFDVLSFTPWTFQLTPLFEFYGGINLDYSDDKYFSDPQFTAYYSIDVPLITSDMVDNTKLTFEFAATGDLYPMRSALHHFIFKTAAKYGDSWEVLLGYDLVNGNTAQDPLGTWMFDRDAFTFKLTYHFI